MREINPSIVLEARLGNPIAVEQLIRSLKDDIFNIATKFHLDFHDAEDATQEILIRILKNLPGLKSPERILPWSYRITVNYLKSEKKRRKSIPITFEIMEVDCRSHLGSPEAFIEEEEKRRLTAELKISCTTAMLFCLSFDERIAFVFHNLFELSGKEAADITGINEATYRKRLSRARNKVESFLRGNCSLLNEKAACKCRSRVSYALSQKRLERGASMFISGEYLASGLDLDRFLGEMEALDDVGEVYRHNPLYRAPERVTDFLAKSLRDKKFHIFTPYPSQKKD